MGIGINQFGKFTKEEKIAFLEMGKAIHKCWYAACGRVIYEVGLPTWHAYLRAQYGLMSAAQKLKVQEIADQIVAEKGYGRVDHEMVKDYGRIRAWLNSRPEFDPVEFAENNDKP